MGTVPAGSEIGPEAESPPEAGIHLPNFGTYLKERMDRLGIECQLRHSDDEARTAVEMTVFFVRHLKPVL